MAAADQKPPKALFYRRYPRSTVELIQEEYLRWQTAGGEPHSLFAALKPIIRRRIAYIWQDWRGSAPRLDLQDLESALWYASSKALLKYDPETKVPLIDYLERVWARRTVTVVKKATNLKNKDWQQTESLEQQRKEPSIDRRAQEEASSRVDWLLDHAGLDDDERQLVHLMREQPGLTQLHYATLLGFNHHGYVQRLLLRIRRKAAVA